MAIQKIGSFSMDTLRTDVRKALENEAKPSTSKSNKYYRVQAGAYSVKANAETQLERAKKLDFLMPI